MLASISAWEGALDLPRPLPPAVASVAPLGGAVLGTGTALLLACTFACVLPVPSPRPRGDRDRDRGGDGDGVSS